MEKSQRQKTNLLLSHIVTWPYLPLFVFGIIIFIMHLLITPDFGDDIYFSNTFAAYNYDPVSFSLMRYVGWTSRTIIELLLVLAVSLPPIVWKLADTLLIIAIGVFLSKTLVCKEHRFEGNIVIAALMLVYTYEIMSYAGWVATTVNYIWPLAFGLMAIYPLRKIADGKKFKLYEYFLYSVALLIGANQEQMCFVLFAVYTAFTITMFVKKRVKAYVLVQLGLCLLSLVYILTCPGNAARVVAETATWFPDYAAFSLVQKAELGLSGLLSALFLKNNWLLLILSFFVFVLVWQKHRNALYRIVAAIPLFSLIALFALHSLSDKSDKYIALDELFKIVTNYGIVNSKTLTSGEIFWTLFRLLFICCTLFISLYILFGNERNSFIAIGILFIGMATKVVLGFSPTVWASGERTELFLVFSLIACTIHMLNSWDFKNKGSTQLMLSLFVACGFYGGVVNMFVT